jgi:hypothetical protein
MIDRILKNWKTSSIGVGLIISGVVLVWFEKATLTEMGAFIGVGLYALFMNDPKKKKVESDESEE